MQERFPLASLAPSGFESIKLILSRTVFEFGYTGVRDPSDRLAVAVSDFTFYSRLATGRARSSLSSS